MATCTRTRTDGVKVPDLVDGLVRLDASARDKRQARVALLRLLTTRTDGPRAFHLVDDLAKLDPAVPDFVDLRAWMVEPNINLLSAVRRNSPRASWLTVLPSVT